MWSGSAMLSSTVVPASRFEIEHLRVAEVDEAGRLSAMILFDLDDERAAQREAWARWAAIDPVAAPWVELLAEFTEAWNVHDRTRVRACFADDFVLEDHRHAGIGRIEGAEAYVDSIVALWDLAPDQRLVFGWSSPMVERRGIVPHGAREGTLADGGAFANDYVCSISPPAAASPDGSCSRSTRSTERWRASRSCAREVASPASEVGSAPLRGARRCGASPDHRPSPARMRPGTQGDYGRLGRVN